MANTPIDSPIYPIDSKAYGAQKGAGNGTSEIRRPVQPRESFADTFKTLGQSVQISMANQFLQQTLAADAGGNGNGGGGMGAGPAGMGGMGGMGLLDSRMQMNMLLTMAAMQMDHGDGHAQAAAPEAAKAAAAGSDAAKTAATADAAATDDTGALSSRFESGPDGAAAVGYDRVGGTSYGTYQLSSTKGSLKDFLDFLDDKAPALAERLRDAGPANTGSTRGGMPDAWRAVAAEEPDRFAKLQHDFVEQSHYRPALSAILDEMGLSENQLPKALREVIFSTAVQHGANGAADIFATALSEIKAGHGPRFFRELIDKVYAERGRHFGGSTEQVREAVLDRFTREKALALASLENNVAVDFA
ncbi:hypothetical protein dsx2_0517 [Desulfovibrio sp. X2]|uniref:VgrG-related protein n=1 Tax=Desulfovibrio sp. X2 TaxID=941449 RepID=UPI0003588A9D|nr:hypothetical protein [Desulfovibrio sp. X2]EPR38708.1 hypothetical protein dsx2_0517 [Desulfovibrio sp. X2]